MKSFSKIILLLSIIIISILSCSKDDGPQLSPAEFSADVSSLDFGEVVSNQQSNLEIIITNTGEQDLVLESFTLSGTNASDFTVDAVETVIEGDNSYAITVTLAPTTEGAKAATLTIISNVGEHQIDLTGNAFDYNAIVYIPDTNFKTALLAQGTGQIAQEGVEVIDLNEDGEIQVGEALSYTKTINCTYKEINVLTGIEAFKNLTTLMIGANNLTSIDLSNNIALENLTCSNNELISIDLTQNTALKSVDISNNKLEDIDLSKNLTLESLTLNQNNLTSLDLTNNIQLTTVFVSNNKLEQLNISKNIYLTHLDAHFNNLSSLDFSNNISIEDIGCRNNNLVQLDLSKNVGLKSINFANNLLESIDVSKNIEIINIYIFGNNLSNIDVSQNSKLRTLSIAENQLTDLDILNNTSLNHLNVNSNFLSELNFSNNQSLEYLFTANNQLTQIDISNHIYIKRLICYDNQLISLNIANGNNSNMEFMYANGNPDLTCIQIDSSFTPPSSDNWRKNETANYSDNCQ